VSRFIPNEIIDMKREGNGLIYFLVTLKLPAELTTGTEPVPLPHWFPENEAQELLP
jgi:hypothetical protein